MSDLPIVNMVPTVGYTREALWRLQKRKSGTWDHDSEISNVVVDLPHFLWNSKAMIIVRFPHMHEQKKVKFPIVQLSFTVRVLGSNCLGIGTS